MFKLLAQHYFTVQQRSADKLKLPKLNRLMKQYLNADVNCAEWLIKEVTCWEIIKELILEPSIRIMVKFVSGQIYAAMVMLYEKEKASLNFLFTDAGKMPREQMRRTVLGDFMIMLLNYLPYLKDFLAHQAQYLQLIA